MEVSVTYGPQIHDTRELRRLGRAVRRILGSAAAVHLQPLLPAHRMRDIEATTAGDLVLAREVLLETGLRHVYMHVLGSPAHRTTWCACGAALVERGIRAVRVLLDEGGCCRSCGSESPIGLRSHTDAGRLRCA